MVGVEGLVLGLGIRGESFGNHIESKIKLWIQAGMSEGEILQKISDDLSPGGVTYSALVRDFQNSVGGALDTIAVEAVRRRLPGVEKWLWVCVSDEESCDDCLDRDGKIKSWKQWVNYGLPGYATRCGFNCRCSLEPLAQGLESESE